MPSFPRQLSQFNQVVTFADANNNLVIANNIILPVGNVIFGDGTTLNTAAGLSGSDTIARNTANAAFIAANSAGSYANSAFGVANNSAGVNLTQNTNITSASTYANGAFGAANTADIKATSAGIYANGAFTAANAATATDTTQNNSITAAFIAANSAGIYANSAYTRANNSLNANTGGTITGAVTVSTINQGTDGLILSGPTNILRLMPQVLPGNFNSLAQANDSLISFTTGQQGLGSLTIAGWNSITSGMRIGANGNVQITSANTTATSSNTGGLVITNGFGVTGNLYMSNANNYTGSGDTRSYRMGWTDNYFARNAQFSGLDFVGGYFSFNSNAYVEGGRLLFVRGLIGNDTGNATVIFRETSPVLLQNTTPSTSTSTGALRVNGGLGVSGNVYADAIYDSGVEVITFAQNAYNAANTADSKSVTAGSYSNSGFAVANSASIYANGAFARANSSLSANSGGTVTGNVTIIGDFAVTGNLVITGNTITQNVSTLNIVDPLIYLAANNYVADDVDIGFVGNYFDGASQRHTGVFRDAANKIYYIFDNYNLEPVNNIIDITNASFRVASLNANIVSQTVTVRGVEVLTYANGAFGAANVADAKAVTAGSYANSAFASANNQNGVNLTQNTNITSASTYANGAFGAANTADSKAVSAGSYANSAFTLANNQTGVDTTQNTNITSASTYANGAFAAANVADNKAVTSGSYANSAFGVANTANDRGLSAGIYANGSFVAANSAGSYANSAFAAANNQVGVDNTQNTNITSASTYANGAFGAANTADSKAVTAGSYANSAFAAANNQVGVDNTQNTNIVSASTYANGAFAAANTAYSPSNPPPSGGVSITNETASLATYYPIITTTTTGSLSAANVDTSSLYFVPNTGTFSATEFVSLSDSKYKKNIIRISDAGNVVNQLEGVSFNWKENDIKSYGVIAQEIEKIIPEVVQTNDKGIKTVNYDSIIPFLIEAIKEHREEIDNLKRQIESINSRLGT